MLGWIISLVILVCTMTTIPLDLAAFLLSVFCLLTFFVVSYLYESDFLTFHPNVVKIAVMILVTLIAIGFITMFAGFFLWALGEIWTPYL